MLSSGERDVLQGASFDIILAINIEIQAEVALARLTAVFGSMKHGKNILRLPSAVCVLLMLLTLVMSIQRRARNTCRWHARLTSQAHRTQCDARLLTDIHAPLVV